MLLNRAIMLNYAHIYYGYHYAQNYAAKAYPMVPNMVKIYLTTLRTFTMAVDDVLPVTSLVMTCCRFSMTTSPVPVTLHSPFLFQLLPLPLP